MKNAIFWDFTPCGYCKFRKNYPNVRYSLWEYMKRLDGTEVASNQKTDIHFRLKT
jgi:hypothetical protein